MPAGAACRTDAHCEANPTRTGAECAPLPARVLTARRGQHGVGDAHAPTALAAEARGPGPADVPLLGALESALAGILAAYDDGDGGGGAAAKKESSSSTARRPLTT